MKDEHNNKGTGPGKKRNGPTPEEAAAADQTPAVAGPPLETGAEAPAAPLDPGPTGPESTLAVGKTEPLKPDVDNATSDPTMIDRTKADSTKAGKAESAKASEPVVVAPSVDAAAERDKTLDKEPPLRLDQSRDKASEKGRRKGGDDGARVPPAGSPTASGGGSGGKGLGALALLVALAALGLSAWQWYQTQETAQQPQDDPRLVELIERQDATQARMQEISEQLRGVPEQGDLQQIQRLTGDLQRSQQAMVQRLEAIQGEAQTDSKLAEAEYMLRLAGLRLMAAQDVRSAKDLLRATDEILRDQPDSGVFAVRDQLAQTLAELETLPEVDRPGLYLRLAALHEQVNRIVALPVPVFDPEEVTVEEEFEDRMARRTRAERVLMRLERYVRVDFQRGKVVTPLLDEAEMRRIRRTLQLTLEQAQWAALRGEPDVYRASLEQADGMLRQFFELDNPQVRALQSQLALLAEQQVALETPDIAPLQRGLAAYIQSLRATAAGSYGQSPVENGDE